MLQSMAFWGCRAALRRGEGTRRQPPRRIPRRAHPASVGTFAGYCGVHMGVHRLGRGTGPLVLEPRTWRAAWGDSSTAEPRSARAPRHRLYGAPYHGW
eukprot:393741-Prymnesium_polylepis.1